MRAHTFYYSCWCSVAAGKINAVLCWKNGAISMRCVCMFLICLYFYSKHLYDNVTIWREKQTDRFSFSELVSISIVKIIYCYDSWVSFINVRVFVTAKNDVSFSIVMFRKISTNDHSFYLGDWVKWIFQDFFQVSAIFWKYLLLLISFELFRCRFSHTTDVIDG